MTPIPNPSEKFRSSDAHLRLALTARFYTALLAAALIRAAHALVALAGMTVAVGADVDRVQVTAVLRVVMTAGRNGTMNGLIFHKEVPPISDNLSMFARRVVCNVKRKIYACGKRRSVL